MSTRAITLTSLIEVANDPYPANITVIETHTLEAERVSLSFEALADTLGVFLNRLLERGLSILPKLGRPNHGDGITSNLIVGEIARADPRTTIVPDFEMGTSYTFQYLS